LGVAVSLGLLVGARLQDEIREIEFFSEFEAPLFAQTGWADHQESALALGPVLTEHQSGLDGLAEADLVGEYHPHRQGASEGEEGRFDLMRIEVHAGVEEGHGQALDAAWLVLTGKFMGDIFGVIGCGHEPWR
jgi:hypothetical protein